MQPLMFSPPARSAATGLVGPGAELPGADEAMGPPQLSVGAMRIERDTWRDLADSLERLVAGHAGAAGPADDKMDAD